MALILRLVPADEYQHQRDVLAAEYADDLVRSQGFEPERGRGDAERQIQAILPDGVDTAGMVLRSGYDGDHLVGWIWIALPSPERPTMAWIYNLWVVGDRRGRGYGREIMRAAERELAALGVTRVGLNVFGHNPVAIRLYETLGYRTTTQQMAKDL